MPALRCPTSLSSTPPDATSLPQGTCLSQHLRARNVTHPTPSGTCEVVDASASICASRSRSVRSAT